MSTIKVISFDLDNTLWDIKSVILRAEKIQRIWLRRNAPALAENLNTEDLVQIRSRLLAQSPELIHDLSKLRESVLENALCDCGYPGTEARRLAKDGFQVFLKARHDVTFYEGVTQVLELLEQKFVLGALSNGNAEIHRLGLDRYFSFSFSAAAVGLGKPAPDMFRAALAHNRIEPQQMIHVGDHPIDDIQGAGQLGIYTLWINHNGEPCDGPITPSAEAPTFRDVPQSIEVIATLNR